MIKLSAERPVISGKQLPLSVHSSTHVELAPSQPTESKAKYANTALSEDSRAFFGKRNAELNKSTSYLLKSSYQPRYCRWTLATKEHRCRYFQLLDTQLLAFEQVQRRYGEEIEPYEFYGTVLSKSRSTSTPLARSHGPDITD